MGDDGDKEGREGKPGAHSITGGSTGASIAAPSKDLGPGKESLTSKLDVGAPSDARDRQVSGTARDALGTARTLGSAYQRAVNALDGLAAAELAHNIVGAIQIAQAGKQRIIEACAAAGLQTHGELLVIKQQLTTELSALERELAVKLSPQQLDGVPVMGTLVAAQLGDDPIAYLIHESSLTVELLGVVAQVKHVTGAHIGMCPKPSPATEQVVIYLVEPWRSRPVNFAFLVAALRKLHVWDEVSGVKSQIHGKSLADTEQKVAAQAKETGALADVGDLDTEGLTSLLHEAPPGTRGARPGGQWIDDRAAQKVLERLAAASPTARGPLVQQIARMGKLGKVCDHLPKQAVQALHDAIQPFDAPSATMLVPFFSGKGGEGRSMHKVYEDKVMDNLHDGKNVRAYLWTFLDTAHNALTMGFQHEYSQAYDAHESGQITDDAFLGAGGKALGKAGAIGLLSAATGGAAGAFGEGFAAGLGASKSVAALIGAGVGGVGAGVGGHLGGDMFDQAFNGKQGFDSFGSYMQSGAEGGITGTILGGISVGAGKYLNKSGGARPIDRLATRYPQNAGILERLRTAGFGTGAQTRATAIKIKVTAAELADMLASGLIGPQPAFATSLAGLPPRSQIEISVRPQPMQMSAPKPPAGTYGLPGSQGGSHADSAGKSDAPEPKLEIDEIKPVETTTEKPAKAKPDQPTKQTLAEHDNAQKAATEGTAAEKGNPDGQLWSVDPATRAADEAAGVIVNGAYIKNPTARSLKSLLNQHGKIGSKLMSGEFMYVVSVDGDIILGTRAGQRMPHPTLIGGANPKVRAAGIVDIRGGRVHSVNNASGHFKPGENSLEAARAAFENLPKNAFSKDFKGYVEYE